MKSAHQYVWQHPEWPQFRYDMVRVARHVADARRAQGFAEGKLTAVGLRTRQEIIADAWAQDALATAAIEGERLNIDAVRSSIARRLGTPLRKAVGTPRQVDGLLDIMQDAVHNAAKPVTHDRLQGWQAALFPTGFSSMNKIRVGAYRSHDEPMQIVSGRIGYETVHYEAPSSERVPDEMEKFVRWLNEANEPDAIVRAALAHLWFESIHPFEDGNGRVGRAIIDLVLAKDSDGSGRMLRISQRLAENRDAYYDELGRAQHGDLDVTEWVLWFTEQFHGACVAAAEMVDQSLKKGLFWTEHSDKDLNDRQRKIVNLLLDAGPRGFEGDMSTRKYESIAATSRATASRELGDLETKGLLRSIGSGRATRYFINLEGWEPIVNTPPSTM